MNMGLLAADLSLGRPLKESQLRSKDTDIGRQRQHLHPLVSCDLHALELYHKALEDERLKIQVFQRELPFCMQLLDDAIEASREQLEERLTCKLNTPMHEPPATAAATHEFVCNYTSSLNMQKSSLPNMVGEINLRFKRKWTASSSTSAQDVHGALGPYHAAASACPTKWLLHQNTSHPTKLTHEGSPSTIKGCIKLQESAVPDEVLPTGADESHKASLVMSSNGRAFVPSCVSYNPTHALQMQNPMQLPSPSHKQAIADTYRMLNKSPAAIQDPEGERQLTHTVPVRSINVATFDANHSPISSYSRSISITNLSPKELQMSPGMSSPLAKASSHGSLTPPSGGVQRKPRRCWSPELHQRFLSALRHLGGCQVATPKQIRELMNVEGLTNDEVKSHLQKFRLHMRRPNGVMANSQSDLQQAAAHHLLVFGHIWVPPEYGEQHQHAANLNINSITDNADCVHGLDVASSSCGPMTVMKSISSNSLINNANHIHSLYSYNDHTANSENDGTAQAPVLRLCQDEYSGDHGMQQSKAMHAPIRLLDEEEGGQKEVTDRNVSAYAMCERTSGLQQQVGNNDNDGHHHHHSTLSSTGEHLRHDCDIAMKKKLLASDQSAIKQLLQLHAGAASAIMDDKEHENDHEILRNEDSLEINLSIGCDSGNAKTPLHKMEYNERILSGNSTADVADNINKSKDDHENIQNDDISRSRGNESN